MEKLGILVRGSFQLGQGIRKVKCCPDGGTCEISGSGTMDMCIVEGVHTWVLCNWVKVQVVDGSAHQRYEALSTFSRFCLLVLRYILTHPNKAVMMIPNETLVRK